MSMDSDLAQHIKRMIDLELKPMRAACRVYETGYGSIILHPAYPILYDANLVIIKRMISGLSIEQLEQQLRPMYQPLGVTHLRFLIPDPEVAAALEPECTALAYKHSRYLIMEHVRPSERQANPEITLNAVTSPVGFTRLDQLEHELMRELAWNSRAMRSALSTRRREVAAHLPMRWFWAEYKNTTVGSIGLLTDGPYASIQEVSTRPNMRGRGVASTMVLALLDQARAAGARVVSLTAEADDWPKNLYSRLGFESISSMSAFLKEFEP